MPISKSIYPVNVARRRINIGSEEKSAWAV